MTRTAIEGFLDTLPSFSYKKQASDVSWLLLDQTQVSRKAGWMTVGHKGGKERTIDLVNEARSLLYDYFQQGERKASAYVFTSQRAKKVCERGRNRRMAVDRGWHPPLVAATQSKGAPGRSQIHQ